MLEDTQKDKLREKLRDDVTTNLWFIAMGMSFGVLAWLYAHNSVDAGKANKFLNLYSKLEEESKKIAEQVNSPEPGTAPQVR